MNEQELQQLHEEYVDLQVVKVYLKEKKKTTRIYETYFFLDSCNKEIDKRQDEIRKIMSKNI